MVLAAVSGIPDDITLARGLSRIFDGGDTVSAGVQVVRRRPLAVASTFPAEVVTCRVSAGHEHQLFCKYAICRDQHSAGVRGGIPYEAAVYRDLLGPLSVGASHCYGAYTDSATGAAFLVIEFLEGAWHVNQVPDSEMVVAAARWLGVFQRKVASQVVAAPDYLMRYDHAFISRWAHRAASYAETLGRRFPWFARLCGDFARVAPALLLVDPTVIHGEYYPLNILVHQGKIVPVDWESTAIAAGEIDLASLTEQWSDDVALRCETAYTHARWPSGTPAGFQQRLEAARLFLQLRWLGDRQEWTLHESLRPRFAQAELHGSRLGLL